MNILFAPDWRQGVPYQTLLAEALVAAGVHVAFLSDYKRVLPLTRLLKQHPADLLHLHWPEAYYPRKGDWWDGFRRARFVPDLTLATRRTPFVLTAHNLMEHNERRIFAHTNYAAAYRQARLVFAHSAMAAAELIRIYGISESKIRIVPHGDLSVMMPPPVPQAEARANLGLPEGPLCLMFGAMEPYKGQEEVLAHWRQAHPKASLVIVGKPRDAEYAAVIRDAGQNLPNVILRLGWLADSDLALYLSAADVALFNYRTIFTSGAASLARCSSQRAARQSLPPNPILASSASNAWTATSRNGSQRSWRRDPTTPEPPPGAHKPRGPTSPNSPPPDIARRWARVWKCGIAWSTQRRVERSTSWRDERD
jgi:beta-1,4-mannosyltransferase